MIKSFSVPRIWVPTKFKVLDAGMSERCNLAGCENCRVSARAREVINNPDPELLHDHWFAQDDTLRRDLGRLHDVAPEQVFLTSGAIGGIRYSFEVLVGVGTQVGLLRPDWPGFLFFAEHARAQISYLERPTFPFRFEARDLIDFVRKDGVEFVIISNPSAVTGFMWEPGEVEELLAACPDTMFVIDEADSIYPHLSADQLVNRYGNAVFLQSFSKFYGLSGLRIGYMVTPAAYAEDFDRTINPAELTSLSILAARAAFNDTAYQQETQRTVRENLLALETAVSDGSYQLVDQSRCFAAYLWADESRQDPFHFLAERGIDIVPGEAFGLQRGGRVNLSNPVAINTLINALVTRDLSPAGSERA